jgi:hypothetical protein
MGHADIRTTLGYVHVGMEQKRKGGRGPQAAEARTHGG